MSLKGKVALVTGASRGIGRGIALQLGEAGATVYITGRKPENYDRSSKLYKPGQLEATAEEVTKRGGKGIAVFVDHADGKAVKALFDQIDREQQGQLDILVNNAMSGIAYLSLNAHKKFYEVDPDESWDIVNNVGLRDHYISSWHATKLMLPRKTGLIVMVSSFGGMSFMLNTVYGVGKTANDRLASDLAVELRGTGISVISLWPGTVQTEIVDQLQKVGASDAHEGYTEYGKAESTEFSGKAIVALATDPNLKKESGKILMTQFLARKYNLFDIDGSQPNTYNGRYDHFIEVVNKLRVDQALS